MKKFALTVAIVVSLASLYLVGNMVSPELEVSGPGALVDQSAQLQAPAERPVSSQQASPTQAGDAVQKQRLDERRVLAEAKKADIDKLMESYKEHIGDPEKVRELQKQVAGLISEYNELILPVATAQMAERADRK